MRPLLLLLALAPVAFGGPKLLKDLKKYDPVVLPKDRAIQQEWKDMQAEAVRKAAAKHGGKQASKYAPNFYKDKLRRLKMRLLKTRIAQHNDELNALLDDESVKALQSMCDVYALAAARTDDVDARRDEHRTRLEQIFRESGSDAMSPKATYNARYSVELHQRQIDDQVLRVYGDHLLDIRLTVARGLRDRDTPEALKYLGKTALVRGKHPSLRAKVAEVLSNRSDADPDVLMAALKKEKDTGARAVLVAALGRLRDKSRKYAGQMGKLIGDPSERVRIATVRALTLLRAPETVPMIIKQMPRESGATLFAFSQALTSLTGAKHGIFPDVWARWWESNGPRILAEGLPRATDMGEQPRKGDGGFFYGIPQISQRIIYVIDISGSMKHKVGKGSRLDACRKEFKRAIGALRPGATFNLIVYNKDARPWDKKNRMVVADDKSRASAGKFVDGFEPAQNTNIYDALRLAFKICGAGAKKHGKPLHADTIYLLTDGSPTKPAGGPDDTKKILEAARQWNAARVVTIHTIGIGDKLNAPFLAQLARDHNGQFIHKKGQ